MLKNNNGKVSGVFVSSETFQEIFVSNILKMCHLYYMEIQSK